MQANRKSFRGFTLIELLIVVAIIAILAAIAVPNFLEAQVRAKTARAKSDMRTIVTGVESYHVDFGAYPEGTDNKLKYAPAIQAYLDPLGLAEGFYAFRATDPDPGIVAGRDFATITTPLAYINSIPTDPFAEVFLGYAYRNAKDTKNGYILSSFGPDNDLRSDLGGGLGKGSDNTGNPFSTANDSKTPSRLGDLNERAVIHAIENTSGFGIFRDDLAEYMADLSYDPTNGTLSEGDIIRVGPGIFTYGD